MIRVHTTHPTNALPFNDWARYICAESHRMAYGKRPRKLNNRRKAQQSHT